MIDPDRYLVKEEPIEPSADFADRVMSSVRAELPALPPIRFPWLARVFFAAAAVLSVIAFASSPWPATAPAGTAHAATAARIGALLPWDDFAPRVSPFLGAMGGLAISLVAIAVAVLVSESTRREA